MKLLPLKSGDEYDALTRAGKRAHFWRAGRRKSIKARFWRRARKALRLKDQGE